VATPVRRIVDTSSLIFLAKIGQLELLRAGVSEIVVPDAVLSEIGARGSADPIFQQIRGTAWLKIVHAPPTPSRVLVWGLGAGESSVLTIALADPECEAILDDRHARRCAQSLGIGIRGTLGTVILAKQLGSLPSARPVVEQLRRVGLFLTDDIAREALALVGE
jgi:predicted nucleic acid-binding protein